jgi:galactonate dehydratase
MMRRDFFAETAGIATFLAAAAQPLVAGRADIKIADIKTFVVGVGSRNLIFVKVETDQGIHGIGEAYSCGPDDATVATINDFKRWLVGQDPRNIEHLWAMMMNFTRFPGGLVVNAASVGLNTRCGTSCRTGA